MLSHLANRDSAPSTSATDALRQTTAGAAPNTTAISRLSPAYRLLLSQRILAVCSQNTYENVANFEWLLSVVVDLVYVARAKIGPQLRDLFIDVVGRVRGARRYAVQLAVKLLSDTSLLSSLDDEDSCSEILWAAAWVAGEYCR
jgi:AP-3 complex subunit delta-1